MEVIHYLGISHAIFGSALLLKKRPKHISNTILATWILSLGIFISGRLIPVPVVSFFKPGLYPILLCFGPFMYLYIKSLTREKFYFSKQELWHFLPFALVVIHRLITEPINFAPGDIHEVGSREQIANLIYYGIATISFVAYTFASFKMIARHKENLHNIYSYKDSRYTLNWINAVAILFLVVFTSRFVVGIFDLVSADFNTPHLVGLLSFYVFSVGQVLFIIIASFFGVNQPVILIHEEGNLSAEDDHLIRRKYERSSLSDTEMSSIENHILAHLKNKKSYLDPEYNINLLSEEIDIPRHHITQVINSNLNKNFYLLVNELRVDEVIKRMSDPSNANYTLLAIAFDSGFNSKSAFNRAFKQTTGKTPSEYKLSLEN